MTTQEFEEYFKDKIDWRDFNYIIGMLTKYEDIGLKFLVKVMVKDYCVCKYDSEKDIVFYMLRLIDHIVFVYDNEIENGVKYPFWYIIDLIDINDEDMSYRKPMAELKSKIENKFQLLFCNNSDVKFRKKSN